VKYKRDGTFTGTEEQSFHIGNNIPPDYDWEVIEVQADGHELDAIKCQMTNIPIGRKRTQRWFGDMAAFIAHNIRLVKEDH